MTEAFTADMGTAAMVGQLNAMRDELIERFKVNENDHKTMRSTLDTLALDQADLGGRLANVQQALATTTDQAQAVLEVIITDARKAFEEVRGEGLLALRAAMEQHEAGLRALHASLSDQVRNDLLGVRAELDATQNGLR